MCNIEKIYYTEKEKFILFDIFELLFRLPSYKYKFKNMKIIINFCFFFFSLHPLFIESIDLQTRIFALASCNERIILQQ